MNIYVASSWRNEVQPTVVAALRAAGHDVYDFKNPRPGNCGFHWSEIDPEWQSWDAEGFRRGLQNTIAQDGFAFDMKALRDCDVCVLVQPAGRSAALEAGWAAGSGRRLVVLLERQEPELMLAMADALCVSIAEVVAACSDEWIG